jgi:hypothetical protein
MPRPIQFIKDYWPLGSSVGYKKGHIMHEPMSMAFAETLVIRGVAIWYDEMPPRAKKAKLKQPMAKRRKTKGNGKLKT